MSDDATAPGGSEGDTAPVTVITPATDAPKEFANPAEAAAALSAARSKKYSDEGAPPATAEPELSDEDNAAPEEDPGEVSEEAEPAKQPPIERPRSWAKELDEEWASYPRAAQEKIVAREQERDAAIRRSQNEAAEARKAAEAERVKTEEARKAYEAKLPALMESLQRQSEFADIKTMDDVRKLQAEDPFRFQAWQVYQMDAQAVQAEKAQAEQRQLQAKQAERSSYEREQGEKLHDLVPEMKDPAKASELRSKAVDMLKNDYGFSESELSAVMQSDDGYKLLTDARWQKLIADGLKYAELKKAPPKAAPPTLPPVQRPGTARPTSGDSERIKALTDELNRTGSIKAAQELRTLQVSRRR